MKPSGLRDNCTAPRPNRIDGISADTVPSQLSWKKLGQNSAARPMPIAAPMKTPAKRAQSLSVRELTMAKATTCRSPRSGERAHVLREVDARAEDAPVRSRSRCRPRDRGRRAADTEQHDRRQPEEPGLTMIDEFVMLSGRTRRTRRRGRRSRPRARRRRASRGGPRRRTCSRRSPTSGWRRWRGPTTSV